MNTQRDPAQNPCPHLYVTPNLMEAIKSVGPQEWQKFFLSIKANKLEAVETCPDQDLTKERGKITMVTELQGIFMTIQNFRKPTTE